VAFLPPFNAKKIQRSNFLVLAFFGLHALFALFLGRLYALAPDESGYLFTFNHLYTLPVSTYSQTASGWITAPTIFLRIAYLPAKVLTTFGVPDFLSIRLLSILLTSIALYLILNLQIRFDAAKRLPRFVIVMTYLIPSVFLWTSVGLRESFILFELTVFLTGLNLLLRMDSKKSIFYLFVGSYGLISTKNYLWACLMAALLISSMIFYFKGIGQKKLFKFIVAGFFAPLIAFAGTTSAYALDYILHGNISDAGTRSGDSITQVYLNTSGTGPTETLITFHGDYSLVAIHFYLKDHPNAPISKIVKTLHFDKKIQSIWNEKIKLDLINENKQSGVDSSSLNGHILKPGKLSNPISLFWPAFTFLCGPFPFVNNSGLAITIASLESPLWWAFYAFVIFQFIRFRKVKFLRDPQILFTLIFLAGEVAFSALVEVNLGTSFRHRSILLVPLVFLYVRLAQRAKEQEDLEPGVI